MIASAPKRWPRRRWWLMLALIFTGQLGFIFALSDRKEMRIRPPMRAPTLTLARNISPELLALWDPTLFALPHRQGFSSAALKVSPPPETRSTPPPEPLDFLALPVERLALASSEKAVPNMFDSAPARSEPSPELGLPALFPPAVPTAPSAVRIEGPLAQRRLLNPIVPPPWPHREILNKTVVHILVDADGRATSPGIVIGKGSGSKEADQKAVELARGARFESIRREEPVPAGDHAGLTSGRIIFEWQTIPGSTTNAGALPP